MQSISRKKMLDLPSCTQFQIWISTSFLQWTISMPNSNLWRLQKEDTPQWLFLQDYVTPLNWKHHLKIGFWITNCSEKNFDVPRWDDQASQTILTRIWDKPSTFPWCRDLTTNDKATSLRTWQLTKNFSFKNPLKILSPPDSKK